MLWLALGGGVEAQGGVRQTSNFNPSIATASTGGGISMVDDKMTQLTNYKRIADDIQVFESAYQDCIDAIPNSDYTETTITECVGPNFSYVINDIDYERRKILAASDNQLRSYMIQFCYAVAGLDTVMSNGCDLIEKDALDFMWAGLNFQALLDFNNQKYLFEYSQVPKAVFNNLMTAFTSLYKTLDTLVTEVENHKELALVQLKEFIDNKTKSIVQLAAQRADQPMPKITTQTIQVTQTVTDPNSFNLDSLPAPIVQDTSSRNMFTGSSGLANPQVVAALNRHPNISTSTSGLPSLSPVTMFSQNSGGSVMMTASRHLKDDPAPKQADAAKEKPGQI